MANILILGGSGQIARLVTQQLLEENQHHLFLYCRNAKSIQMKEELNIFEGDVNDPKALEKAMIDIDIVYANLSGADLGNQAQAIVTAMKHEGIKRLIFITSMGIYNEVTNPSQNLENNPILKPYRAVADIVEATDLDYTLIRPGWFTNSKNPHYQLCFKGEKFTGSKISKSNLVKFICEVINKPDLYKRKSVGIFDD
ncbi:SDR family oxidoreductase [Acinetobacter puyangensis]|uniref:Uncharacterized conserved protein YbjT, contains NAD(P)-binding and DUF2867 domains n=1 Tax=Acinetobacter puyangensis TaxID=1096779 RepID=A0A240E6C4_9GAMM|nr:NAD(P)H-binding protein [Acinetobacter puyangensis]SNX44314.1 Uncharacterized conserved protein YbjT, contains NAD(P)-binding and DUF2867 domains [Acinetobacter puyangensis]